VAPPDLVVFVGPTIARDDHRLLQQMDGASVQVMPPVAQGDVYRACRAKPRAIAIVDGYFDQIPSVWHKEILWAMSSGVHVFGAASMGALRAAELADFGMVGVGEIFRAFRDRVLEDDDEVAVAHATEDDGFRVMSEALVNIRWTLADAAAKGVIDERLRDAILAAAKSLFYPERTYTNILRAVADSGASAKSLGQLECWLPTGKIDQKRIDALELLAVVHDFLSGTAERKRVAYRFENTDAWDGARRLFDRTEVLGRQRTGDPGLLEELKLSGGYREALDGALLRHLAIEDGRRLGHTIEGEALSATLEAFRRERGLFDPADMDRWTTEQQLVGEAQLVDFVRDQGVVQWVQAVSESDAIERIPDWLRARGTFGALRGRAEAKREALDHAGLQAAELGDAGLTERQLIDWFARTSGTDVPADLATAAARRGFESPEALIGAILREYLYCRSLNG